MLYAHRMNSQVNLNPPWTHIRPMTDSTPTSLSYITQKTNMTFCYQVSDQILPQKCLPGSKAFSPNQSPLNPQSPQNQPKRLKIEASRTADHIAKG